MSERQPSSPAEITSKRDLKDLCEVADYETGEVLRTTFTFLDHDDTAWFGQVSGVRNEVEDVKRSLSRIEDDLVYPLVVPGLTIVAHDELARDSIYIKRPKLLCLDNAEETKLLPKMLVEEAKVLEFLKAHCHRNLVRYHGCVSRRGRIVGLALEKHDVLLQYRFEDDPRELDIDDCVGGIRAGIEHLHSLGFAHNDLNPMNVAFDKNDRPILLDFGSCRRVGETLLSAGTPGWVDEDFETSEKRHDDVALGKVEAWMIEKRRERASGNLSSLPQ